ncbi:MAG: hemerythrin domain-containing protein [Bacteroidetes bacterium]|nr:hemerythrin domain-containing protein [Bacteroidota bacterium]
MKLITPSMKMAEVLESNYLLLPVLSRFGIKLGFGEKTVRDICIEKNIDIPFFVAMLNTFSNENYFPEEEIHTFNVLAIVNYLRSTHTYYLQTLVPTIEQLIDTLAQSRSQHNRSLKSVKRYFREYKKELIDHLKQEDTVTFPYIEQIYYAYHGLSTHQRRNISKEYSMKMFKREHTNIDEKLLDLKNILIKYISGEYDEVVCNAIIFELFRLEKDIIDHTRIENTILLPLVAKMEQSLKCMKR